MFWLLVRVVVWIVGFCYVFVCVAIVLFDFDCCVLELLVRLWVFLLLSLVFCGWIFITGCYLCYGYWTCVYLFGDLVFVVGLFAIDLLIVRLTLDWGGCLFNSCVYVFVRLDDLLH